MQRTQPSQQSHDRIIIHFDYDCFYAAVVENENPALKSVPLAIQQKQIVVTCNYEARRRGLHKLQLITEAKRICPDAVIILGEDLTRFRNASKELYGFLTSAIWSNRAERLGFDEVWLDCTDMVDYNYDLLNVHDLRHSFFCTDREDPTCGFEFDAAAVFGPTYPKDSPAMCLSTLDLTATLTPEQNRTILRLRLGSHLARHLRHELERHKGYTATVGIAANKILSKLVGNVNKPKSQTTLVPFAIGSDSSRNPVLDFMDSHDIGKIPGVGFKLAQKIRARVLGRAADFAEGLVYGGTKEHVTVRDVRLFPNMGLELLEDILGGPGSPRGIGGKMWALLHGIDDAVVGKMKKVPTQISQEDSYMKYLDTFEQARHQLALLSERLLTRMRVDLTEDDEFGDGPDRRWLAHPRTLRLSTRPRPPLNEDGTRTRTFSRISRSAPMPTFAFNLSESPTVLADKLVEDTLVPMFRKLHPQRHGWNLSLINIAVTNMAETGADSKDSTGRDIGRMFKRQEAVLKDFQVTNLGSEPEDSDGASVGSVERKADEQSPDWASEEDATTHVQICHKCQAEVPIFALDAHQRYHALSD